MLRLVVSLYVLKAAAHIKLVSSSSPDSPNISSLSPEEGRLECENQIVDHEFKKLKKVIKFEISEATGTHCDVII